MCPDTVTLSAYFDGELPADKAVQVKEHIALCHSCGAALANFAFQREILRADAAAMTGHAGDLSAFWYNAGHARFHRKHAFRRLSVPVPVAAAALLALTLATVMHFIPLNRRSRPASVVSQTVTPGEIDDFLTFLEGRGGLGGEAIHTLPAELPVIRFGEAQIVRPSGYERSP